MNRLGIEMLTLLGMPPVEHVRLAADLGCVGISTGLTGLPVAALGHPEAALYPPWSLADDASLRRELRAALADTGVAIALGEGFRIRPDGDARDNAAGLDLMAELGAKRINAVSMEADRARCEDQLAVLAAMVAERGMAFTIEFAPPNAVATLADAVDLAGRIDGAKVLIDAMHLFRSGGTIAELRALDPGAIGYAQLCDAPLVSRGGSYMEEAIFGRRVPGDGELPLADFVAALPAECEIGLEVPDLAALLADGPRAHAGRVVAAARALGA